MENFVDILAQVQALASDTPWDTADEAILPTFVSRIAPALLQNCEAYLIIILRKLFNSSNPYIQYQTVQAFLRYIEALPFDPNSIDEYIQDAPKDTVVEFIARAGSSEGLQIPGSLSAPQSLSQLTCKHLE
jgi:hypothetical protein